MPQLIQQLYASILYGPNLENISNFQTFSPTPVELDGSQYYFLDADLSETNKRQTQFSSTAQRLSIRSNPESSQTGTEIPGLSIAYQDFALLRIIQLIQDTKGLRDAILKTTSSYSTFDDKTLLRNRKGVYQIVGCKIAQGMVTLKLQSGITPNLPSLDVRRSS